MQALMVLLLIALSLGMSWYGLSHGIAATVLVQYLTVIGAGLAGMITLFVRASARVGGPMVKVIKPPLRLSTLARPFYLFINGILAETRDREWDVVWANWITVHNLGLSDFVYYWTGVFGCWGKQTAIDICRDKIRGAMSDTAVSRVIVGTHSFGTVIFLEAMKQYPDLKVGAVYLMGAACPEDCDTNGLNALLQSGRIVKVQLGVSQGDWILRLLAPLQRWRGFGQLGYTGAVNVAPGNEPMISTIRHDDYGHEDWVYAHAAISQKELVML